MLTALSRALAALFSPPLRGVVVLSVALAAASFLVLWVAVAIGLGALPTVGWRPVNWFIDLLGTVGVVLLSWLLFPTVVTLITGFFLERVAAAVEAMDYPGRGPPRRQPIGEIMAALVRLTLLSLVLNLLALPIYLLLPLFNIAVYLALNGYLLGREYFEVVALRRLDLEAARALRRRCSGRIFLSGVTIAGVFALPILNLVAPVIAAAFMVHVFEGLPRSSATSGTP